MRILLLYGSWGWGHKKAALAIEEVLKARGVSAESRDLLDFMPSSLASFYAASYSLIIMQCRGLWKWIYETTDRNGNGYSPANSFWQSWQFDSLQRFVQQNNFTHIVSTHFTTSALLAGWREKHGGKHRIFSVITDFIAHRYWKRSGLDHYFVATQEVAAQLVLAGLPPESVAVTGIPVSPAFSGTFLRKELRAELGCLSNQKLFLVLTSGYNAANTRRLLDELRGVDGRFLVSAGKDAPNEATVRELCMRDERFTVFGISPRIPDYMNAADILISKPGGITTSEALASGLPMVLLTPIPGQEEGNAQFLLHSKAAIRPIEKRGELAKDLSQLIANEDQMRTMAVNARRLGKPRSTETIVNTVLSYG